MEIRFSISPNEAKQFATQQLRENFLVQNIMTDDKVSWYIHITTGWSSVG